MRIPSLSLQGPHSAAIVATDVVPESGLTSHAAELPVESVEPVDSITVMAWNLAKCDFYKDGFDFKSKEDVRAQLDEITAVVRARDADLLLLSEVVFEALPCDVNQIEYLADVAGFSSWCYGAITRLASPARAWTLPRCV